MSNKEKNIATIRKFWDCVSARDIDAYMTVFTKDAVAHDPINKPTLKTAEERKSYMQGVFDAFATIKVTIDYITPCGDNYTANKWTVVGTPAGGDPVTIEGIDVARHDEKGLIAEIWGYFDN